MIHESFDHTYSQTHLDFTGKPSFFQRLNPPSRSKADFTPISCKTSTASEEAYPSLHISYERQSSRDIRERHTMTGVNPGWRACSIQSGEVGSKRHSNTFLQTSVFQFYVGRIGLYLSIINAPGIAPSACLKFSGLVSIIVVPSSRSTLSFAVLGSIRCIKSLFFSR